MIEHLASHNPPRTVLALGPAGRWPSIFGLWSKPERCRSPSAVRHFRLAHLEPHARSALAACVDAESLGVLLRKRGLAIELTSEDGHVVGGCLRGRWV